MSFSLPPALTGALDAATQAVSGASLRAAAEALSRAYRDSATSSVAIRTDADVLAYALSRMPATFAAVATVLAELTARAPTFAPATLIDAGAGPGTATWAARTLFETLSTAELRDSHPGFLALAAQLGAGLDGVTLTTRRADLAAPATAPADLVICAYALTELQPAAMRAAAGSLWSQTNGALVLVEPGRPRDFARLLDVRRALVAEGASVLAPCPHADDCPLVAPDWCHFSVRLPRSRAHVALKGGSLGYEDEKFSYLIVARSGVGAPAAARIIKPVAESKHDIRLDLCAPEGLVTRSIPSRDKPAFKAARKLGWGDESTF